MKHLSAAPHGRCASKTSQLGRWSSSCTTQVAATCLPLLRRCPYVFGKLHTSRISRVLLAAPETYQRWCGQVDERKGETENARGALLLTPPIQTLLIIARFEWEVLACCAACGITARCPYVRTCGLVTTVLSKKFNVSGVFIAWHGMAWHGTWTPSCWAA